MSDGRNRFSVCTVVRNDEDTEQRMEGMRRYQSNCNLMNYTEGGVPGYGTGRSF